MSFNRSLSKANEHNYLEQHFNPIYTAYNHIWKGLSSCYKNSYKLVHNNSFLLQAVIITTNQLDELCEVSCTVPLYPGQSLAFMGSRFNTPYGIMMLANFNTHKVFLRCQQANNTAMLHRSPTKPEIISRLSDSLTQLSENCMNSSHRGLQISFSQQKFASHVMLHSNSFELLLLVSDHIESFSTNRKTIYKTKYYIAAKLSTKNTITRIIIHLVTAWRVLCVCANQPKETKSTIRCKTTTKVYSDRFIFFYPWESYLTSTVWCTSFSSCVLTSLSHHYGIANK